MFLFRHFKKVLLFLATLAVLCPAARADDRPAPAPRPRLGMNLSGPADWNTELPFVDVFRFARPWISQRTGKPWGQGPQLALDAHGWVTRLEPECWAETPLCTIDGGHYPAGAYEVSYEGKGRLTFSGGVEVVRERPGAVTIRVDSSRGGFFLQLRETDPADPVRNLRVILPGRSQVAENDPWNPSFLARWRGVACLRFMDWMETNNSEIRTWDDRPTMSDATWSKRGIPVERMVELANRLQADPWFCMPHQADDGYVRQFAQLVREQLDPKRKVYVEYSNEVWNGQFRQHRYAAEQGQKLGLAEKTWEAAWKYTGVRSKQIFLIWERAFGGTDRLVRVLATQAVNPYVSQQILAADKASQHADALAIAPYMGFNIRPDGKPSAEVVAGWRVAQVLDHVEQVALPESLKSMRDQKAVADRHGLALIAYEGGQHLVGVQGGENNEALTRVLHQANAHPRMGELYGRYLDGWKESGGDLFCQFSSVGRWSKWGSWGLLQYADEDPKQSPKYVATMRWARSLGQPVWEP